MRASAAKSDEVKLDQLNRNNSEMVQVMWARWKLRRFSTPREQEAIERGLSAS